MKAIQITSTGGLGILQYRTVPDPVPNGGEVLVLVYTSGVNFIDVFEDAAEAHRDLESRKSTGELVLSIGG